MKCIIIFHYKNGSASFTVQDLDPATVALMQKRLKHPKLITIQIMQEGGK